MRIKASSGGDVTVQERTPCPDGWHNVRIKAASESVHETRGDTLTVVFSPNGPHRLVYLDIRGDAKGQAMAGRLAAALGLSPSQWADLDPGELVDRDLRIETREWVGNDGKTRIGIDRFEPAKTAATARPKTQAAKVAAARGDEAGGDDDIPF